jgi:hypothetical protein
MTEDQEDDHPLTDEAEQFAEKHDRRVEQGLGNYPHEDTTARFYRLGDDGEPYKADIYEVLRVASSWFVKKDNRFHDVDNLQTSYAPHDIKQVVVHRVKIDFPLFTLNSGGWSDFFKELLDPPVNVLNPEQTIPVWSGKRVSHPTNKQKVLFDKGVASINIWKTPNYREATGKPGNAFWEFLTYVIPTEKEREVFLNWLAWSLQNEGKKPKWAVMLFSQKQGTGKTTLTDVCKALFGEENTGRINGVSKLVARFNKEVLENKLVIIEEVEVKRGSTDANRIKTLITEDSTMVEAKFMPIYNEQIFCAFLMTTNHLPLWLEEADRRLFILNFNHEGYTNGGSDHPAFKALVGRVFDQIKTDAGVKGIYDVLMARDLTGFDAMSLDVTNNSTDIMDDLRDLSPDVVKQQVEEKLDELGIVFVPVEVATKVIGLFARREANAQTHLFTELGWGKKRFAWGGGTQKWAWVKSSKFPPRHGKVWDGGDYQTMASQVSKVERLLDGNTSGGGASSDFQRVGD